MFNSRIYTGDGEIHFSGAHLGGKPAKFGTIRFNEDNLDSEREGIRGLKNMDRMNRAVFQMKPILMENILEKPRTEKIQEGYCGLHQKFARTRNMTDLMGRAPLQKFIDADKREQIRRNFENDPISERRLEISPYIDNQKTETFRNSYNKENFTKPFTDSADSVYMIAIKNDIRSILEMLLTAQCFKPFSDKWNALEKNLNRHNWNINWLNENDSEIAYSLNKGEELNFKTRDKNSYLPMKIMVYVICHEMAHVACVNETGHTETFYHTMWLIECAAFMTGLLRPQDFPLREVKFSNEGIVSREIMLKEL